MPDDNLLVDETVETVRTRLLEFLRFVARKVVQRLAEASPSATTESSRRGEQASHQS
jgi:hypothetical protein